MDFTQNSLMYAKMKRFLLTGHIKACSRPKSFKTEFMDYEQVENTLTNLGFLTSCLYLPFLLIHFYTQLINSIGLQTLF